MCHCVYIVKCANDSLYTGYTTDVARRLEEHNGHAPGGAKYTRMHRPVALVFTEEHSSKESAMRREHEIKQLSRKEKIALVRGN